MKPHDCDQIKSLQASKASKRKCCLGLVLYKPGLRYILDILEKP